MEINKLIRSRRRSLSLEVRNNGELIVRAPLRLPYSYVLDVIEEKSAWIKKKQLEIKNRDFTKINERFFLGEKYSIYCIEGEYVSVKIQETKLLITLPKYRTLDAVLNRWYKQKTSDIVLPRTIELAKKFQLNITKISISSARRRWGSCNKKGVLSFSFRIVMLPLETIDYIIIHELAHLVELNHSRQFHAVLKKMLPDYKNHEAFLKKNSYKFIHYEQ